MLNKKKMVKIKLIITWYKEIKPCGDRRWNVWCLWFQLLLRDFKQIFTLLLKFQLHFLILIHSFFLTLSLWLMFLWFLFDYS